MTDRQHWESVYASKAVDAVSWFQNHPGQSLELIERAGATPESSVIDVGAGASSLVDALLGEGYRHLSVLDLSATALAHAKARLGERAGEVDWIEGDIRDVALPAAAYDVWHDRAVFHFLTAAEDRRAYVAQVLRALRPGGHLIVATFGPDGPTQCSGLPVVRYAPEALRAEFGAPFELLEHASEVHVTPAGKTQHFIYCLCRKTL
ncbi:MAG: class I SAM-dependent methyltransferase [Thiobacillaceae bacterium]|nr:class I SAM-dependent methyltransferase [Thiobacillaceae bacterium]